MTAKAVSVPEAGNMPVVDMRLARLLERVRDPAVLAEVAAMPVGKLANMFEMGETQFRRIFKGVTARTPHRYFRECQIREASYTQISHGS